MKMLSVTLIIGALSLISLNLGWLGKTHIAPGLSPVLVEPESDYQTFKKAAEESKAGYEADKAAHPEVYAQQKEPGDQWEEERKKHPKFQDTAPVLDEWPNDAEKEGSSYLVCCDQQGHFYAKRAADLSSFDGNISADGKRFIKQRYCFLDSDNLKPTYKTCLAHFAFYGNFDNKSMYE